MTKKVEPFQFKEEERGKHFIIQYWRDPSLKNMEWCYQLIDIKNGWLVCVGKYKTKRECLKDSKEQLIQHDKWEDHSIEWEASH